MDQVVYILSLLVVSTSGAWQTLSKWDFQLSQLSIDASITETSQEAASVSGCAYYCMSTLLAHLLVSLYFVPDTRMCYCNNALDTPPQDDNTAHLYYGTLEALVKKETIGQETREAVWPPKDCLTLYQFGYLQDGVYEIIGEGGAPISVRCDMTNGGWTVIQERKDGSEDFNRDWSDYVNGFGNIDTEYWLGLETMHYLTMTGSELRVHLEAFPGVSPSSLTANYSSFSVGDAASEYVIHMSGFTGDACGDSFAIHDGMKFSTYDNDNENNAFENCAVVFQGGWWFNTCLNVMLNGRYHQEGVFSYPVHNAGGIHWYLCWEYQHSLKSTAMSVRRQF